MFVLGVTGGIGSGKSAVLDYLKDEKGAAVFSADQAGRDVQRKGGAAYGPIVDLFGEDIVLDDGELDRAGISKIVFHSPEKLAELNAIVHPLVREQLSGDMERARQEGRRLFVVESAILIEVGYRQYCDEVWYVWSSPEVRIERVARQRGLDRERAETVIASQLSDEEYERGCDVTIDNSGDLESLYRMIDRQCERILGQDDPDDMNL